MDSKAQIEAMARKYKEEMLRMYKQSSKTGGGAAETISPPRNVQPVRSVQSSAPPKSVQPAQSAQNVQPIKPKAVVEFSPAKNERIITPKVAPTSAPLMSENADIVKAEPKIPQMQEIPKANSKFPSPEDIMREEFEESMENRFGNEVMSGNNDSDEVRNEPSAGELRPEMTSPRENMASEPENFQGNYNSEEFSDLSDPLEPRYSGDEDETPDVSGVGYIKAEVTTGGGAVPIENAVVLITKKENGKTYLLKMLISDESGSTETVALPAPNVSFSETPDPTEKPFADYYISAYADGFYAENDMEVPVFSGVKSIQPIALIPRSSDDGRAMLG